MRKILISAIIAFLTVASYSQRTNYVEQINEIITPDVALAPLEYLASDELKGRSPKREEINIAAEYIADHFKNIGVKAPDSANDYFQKFDVQIKNPGKNGGQDTLTSNSNSLKTIPAKNVIGWIEGTDKKLKDQFIVLSAHYDHLGVTTQPKMIEGKMDSIYNGARDNAVGVTAVMNAATYFSKHPPKRSIMFIAFTAEEMGMLGSRYFSDHPVIPLTRIVYNLNCDNGGYNDTTIFTIVGLGRTSADDDIKRACAAYGIKPTGDPDSTLHLFDRSDNVNFAKKGIPAPTFGMGVTGFDEKVRRYYHQLSDEFSSMDAGYVLKYIRSYIHAANNIANNPKQLKWRKGDKYEAAWKSLY
jgi:Zn-dependent M28 family amino/carboxypeptidase